MNGINTSRSNRLDLKEVTNIIFDDIYVLLDSFKLEYKEDGDIIYMCCPIHEGSDNPHGFTISKSQQIWRCWTRGCHDEWDKNIFGFVKGMLDTKDFGAALSHICQIYDLQGARTGESLEQKTVVDDSFSMVVDVFKKQKVEYDTVMKATFIDELECNSPYFEGRGFQPSTLKYFEVKDCNSKFSPMNRRSIIPIRYKDEQVGYIARAMNEWLLPKFLFSEGINKTHYLYNYDNAIYHANKTSCLFVVEGQGDVWKLHEAECYNAVGIFGKDVSPRQIKLLLQSGVTTLVVLADNDQAGREGKIKIQRRLGRFFNLIFPAMNANDLGKMTVSRIKESILSNLKGLY